MNIITGYNDPIKIQLNYDNEGKPISKEMQPETHTIINNKITLIQIPDEFYRVVVNGMTELHSYDDSPIQPNNFRVNYQNGLVTFHNSLEGQTIIVNKYWGRGIILTPATRIYSRVNEAGEAVETMQDLIDVGKGAMDELDEAIEAMGSIEELNNKLLETIDNANNKDDILNTTINNSMQKNSVLNTTINNAVQERVKLNSSINNAESTRYVLEKMVDDIETGLPFVENFIASHNQQKFILTKGQYKDAPMTQVFVQGVNINYIEDFILIDDEERNKIYINEALPLGTEVSIHVLQTLPVEGDSEIIP